MNNAVWSGRKGLQTIEIGGVWLRRHGDYVQVLVEQPDGWRLCIVEHIDNSFSHITEPAGIAIAPLDGGKEETK